MKERLIRAVFVGSLLLGSGCAEKERLACPRPIETPATWEPTRERPLSPLLPESWVPPGESYREKIYADCKDLFEILEWERSPEDILDEAVEYLKEQLGENCGPSAKNWFSRIEELKSKTYFLEPYMYIIEVDFPRGGNEKEKLIEKYQEDRKQAIIDLYWRLGLWGMFTVSANGEYTSETDKILINLGQVHSENGKDVLVHEFWHGLPATHIYQDESGDWYRVSGFLQEKWDDEIEVWIPTDISRGLIYSNSTINHALVYLMDPAHEEPVPIETPIPLVKEGEEVYTQVPPPWRAEELIEKAFEVFGKNKVISLYLESNPAEFYRLIWENCDQFSEFLDGGRVCPIQ